MEYINPSEMRAIDINSSYFGVGFRELMDNAGSAVFEELEKIKGLKNKKIIILCGTGNNGGDGFVSAGKLADFGHTPKVYFVGKKSQIRTKESRAGLSELEERGVEVNGVSKADEIDFGADIILDGLLGTGLKGGLRDPIKSLIKRTNSSKGFKVSIDVPSGLGTKTTLKSDLVVALHMAKEGTEGCNTVVRDIGIPKKATTFVGPGDLVVNLKREDKSHKGDNGRVMVVAGCKDYVGAPILTGLGALYAGCDLVTLFVPESILDAARSYAPDFIVHGYKGDYFNSGAVERLLDFSKSQDACVIGPGLGVSVEIKTALNSILEDLKIPHVIDADGLKQVDTEVLKASNAVITPHAMEFEKLIGVKIPETLDDRKKIVQKRSRELSTTILLKSSVDIISSPGGRLKLNETGNPGMTVGGTGDVLAGVVGSYISQGLNSFEAASCAAFVNGAAGDTLYQFKGFGYSASEVAKEIPYTVKRFFDLYG
jgi:NAD(P)H-hydrate epimerase